MPAGDGLTFHGFRDSQRYAVEDAIRRAELQTRAEFSVYVGPVQGEDPRAFATQLHNTLVAPARSILIMVDPAARVLEVVTGGWVRRMLTDNEVALAAEAMRTSFAEGDLVGGLRAGIALLADHLRD